MAEIEAHKLHCRMLWTGEQAVLLRMKLKGKAVECCRQDRRLNV